MNVIIMKDYLLRDAPKQNKNKTVEFNNYSRITSLPDHQW